MARSLIPSDTAIRGIKAGDARRRLSDGNGLYLLLFVKGGSHGWRFDYSINGVRKTLSLGTYPATGLKLARDKAEAARKLVAAGVDPSAHRKAERESHKPGGARHRATAHTFEAVAREWYQTRQDSWAPSYVSKVIRRLEVDVFPWVGQVPVDSITAPQLLQVLRRIEARGVVETAHRALENCNQVFRFAVATGRATSNPGRDLKDALRRPMPTHFPAVTDPHRLGQVLRAFDGYAGTPVVRAALKLTPMLLLRPGELRHAQWEEIDLDAQLWTVPAARMKREKAGKLYGKPHLVFLAPQAVAVLRDLQALTGPTGYVFRGERHHDRPMSDATLNAAMRAMGFSADELTGHGFRATARTILAERLGVAPEVIEAQLAHAVRDSLGRAYNRTQHLQERKVMMVRWADYLDQLRLGDDSTVVSESEPQKSVRA